MTRERFSYIVKRRVLPGAGLIGVGVLLSNLALVGGFLQGVYNYLDRSPRTGTIKVEVVDSSRQPFTEPVLITVIDGNQKQVLRRYLTGPAIEVRNLQFFDNFGDNYIVIVWSRGYKQAGFHPVKLKRGETVSVNLMLVPDDYKLNFQEASWDKIKSSSPMFYDFVRGSSTDEDARARYERLMEEDPLALAHVLNVEAVLSEIELASGRTVFSYYKELVFDETLKKNNFYSWVDRALVDQMRQAVHDGIFEYAAGSHVFHKGNTASFKELSYWEANAQVTFYERNSRIVDGVEYVLVETDIDYYRDPAAHILLEVLPFTVGGSMTDPVQVYQLRWISVNNGSGPEFSPLYSIEPKR